MEVYTQIAQLTDNLYLCGATAVTPKNLKKLDITLVFNCTIGTPDVRSKDVIRIAVEDTPQTKLDVHFDRCADVIQQVCNGGGSVLVHCRAGISRSPSLCLAYLMKYKKLDLKDAYHYVKAKRPFIRPNVGFFQQLIDYEKKLFGTNSVWMVDSPIGLVPTVYKDELKHMVWY